MFLRHRITGNAPAVPYSEMRRQYCKAPFRCDKIVKYRAISGETLCFTQYPSNRGISSIMKRPLRFSINTVLSFVLLLLIALLMFSSVSLVRDKLMHNTQEMGMSLAQSYGAETELRLDDYLKALDMAGKYMDELCREDAGSDALQAWLRSYSDKLEELFGSYIVDPYAVIGGEIIAAYPWEGDATYDYGSADWYRSALSAGGGIVFSDVYTDAITGSPVFTISRSLERTGDVLAMDVYLTNESVMDIEDTVPESYHFIILDSKGELLYSRLDKEAGSEEVARYLAELTAGVEDGSLFAYDATITGPDGRNRGVYYAVMNNGWSVIITVPLEDILMGADSPLVGILAAISIMLFLYPYHSGVPRSEEPEKDIGRQQHDPYSQRLVLRHLSGGL